jgi:hypothetical protein
MEFIRWLLEILLWMFKIILILLYLTYEWWYIAVPIWIAVFYVIGKLFPDGFVSGESNYQSGVYTVTTFGDRDNFSRNKVRIDRSPY